MERKRVTSESSEWVGIETGEEGLFFLSSLFCFANQCKLSKSWTYSVKGLTWLCAVFKCTSTAISKQPKRFEEVQAEGVAKPSFNSRSGLGSAAQGNWCT